MRRGEDSGSNNIGKVLRFVSPAPRVLVGTLVVQAVLFLAALGSLAALLLPGLSGAQRGQALLSRGPEWAVPFALFLIGELLRRWANRRLMAHHEGGVSFVDGRRLRKIAWEDVERADLAPGACTLRLRGGEEVALPAPLAQSPEVRAALGRARG